MIQSIVSKSISDTKNKPKFNIFASYFAEL